MTVGQWIKTPKSYVITALIVNLLMASVLSQDIKGVENSLLGVIASLALDVVCCLLEKRKRMMPDGAVITGLLIALILGTHTAPLIIVATAVFAISSKHMLVYMKKPVLNPAAFGLLLAVMVFHSEESWWGAFGDLPAWSVLLLLIGGYLITNRVRKYPQIFAFFGTYFLLQLLLGYVQLGDAADALRPPFINATLFFGFFMLTDPPTSPVKSRDQILFGVIVAATGAIIYGLYGGLMYLFIGLMAGNVFHVVKQRLSVNRPNSSSKRPSKPISTSQR
ncbi:NQR2, RnfD, RnfE family [Paenibacillus sp. UNC496MF]|uniref:RnfABCDGE type electron transport complex subunit D n=1 Tax=Paenibacillus sp. UNC496MF TaxID=1502753 RepID=UPI0008E40435|nr:RnfABCDGE type electron transport complex subunit D [Paenibacillus sp. UNC496MF]SFJ30886.1 NQR2, RnfD, RnfE family [Paenibacillus sp. UNC496MF]